MSDETRGLGRKRGRPGLAEHTEAQILKSARALLAEKGAGALRVRELAQRAGIATGSLYKFFPDLDALIGAVNLQTYRELTQYVEAAKRDHSGGACQQRLMLLATAYLGFVRENAALWSALLDYNRGRSERPEAFVDAEDALFALVEEELSRLPELSVETRPALARALWASVHGIVVQTLPNSLKPDPMADTLAQIELIIGAVARDYS
ncbi:TetR/AcrR family transcriptional regulator [Maricaulis sp.]|uniref:TetR/AcrR family transcriptional regulator n=1 Tax=Maricaulis sp. TaxID=1486257 RepID=UPI002612D57B|nr:TetR/AcrR family transcriptional regulator [Maricaulis sp.]